MHAREKDKDLRQVSITQQGLISLASSSLILIFQIINVFRSPLLSPPPCSLYLRASHHIGKRCLPLCLYLPRRTLTYPSMRPTTFNAALPSAYLVRLASDLKARFSDVLQHMKRWGTEGTVSSSGRGVGTCKVQARLYMLQDCTCIIRTLDANIGIIGEMHHLSISLSLFVMDISRHFLHLQDIRYRPESELWFSTAYFVLQVCIPHCIYAVLICLLCTPVKILSEATLPKKSTHLQNS